MDMAIDAARAGRNDQVRGFAPVADGNARVLVLGSMPGVASLQQARYYAHPRNAFWPIAGQVLGFDGSQEYHARLKALRSAGVALWDVLRACVRPGSLDSAISGQGLEPNDFAAFLEEHPGIRRICFNGAKAATLYRRHVLPVVAPAGMEYAALPSTSPAHAAAGFDAKLAAWRQGLLA